MRTLPTHTFFLHFSRNISGPVHQAKTKTRFQIIHTNNMSARKGSAKKPSVRKAASPLVQKSWDNSIHNLNDLKLSSEDQVGRLIYAELI